MESGDMTLATCMSEANDASQQPAGAGQESNTSADAVASTQQQQLHTSSFIKRSLAASGPRQPLHLVLREVELQKLHKLDIANQ